MKANAGVVISASHNPFEDNGIKFFSQTGHKLPDTVEDEIEAIVYSGTRINIDYFLNDVMDEDHVEDIYEYFKDSETDDLEDAIEELGGDYTEDEIRLVRIKFLSEMAN